LRGGIAGPESDAGVVIRADVRNESRRVLDDVDHRAARALTWLVVLLFLAPLAGCAAPDGSASGAVPLCAQPERLGVLPPVLAEASGLAASRRHAGVLWLHNDSGGEPEVFAVDSAGAVLGRVRVTGAENDDWEDIALGPCPAGECLYIADTGDNGEAREFVTVYRVPEPEATDMATPAAERFRLRYPDGPRDAEALFVLPDARVYLVSKGRTSPITVYRAPTSLAADTATLLERVAELTDHAPLGMLHVTGAGATPDGRHVVVRTYVNLQLYRLDAGEFTAIGAPVALDALAEPQGEAVDIRADGTVLLASEERGGEAGPLSRLACVLEVDGVRGREASGTRHATNSERAASSSRPTLAPAARLPAPIR
jgi:hypothetical protein